MLKKFFSNLLSSFMGAWLALCLFGIVAAIVIVAMVAKAGVSQETETVTKHSILRISLDGAIVETAETPKFDIATIATGSLESPQALNTIVQAIEDAANNKDIDCIYLECGDLSAGMATLNAIRDALVKFKEDAKDKKIMAYGPSMTQACYYIASAADSVFVNPQGELSLHGVYGQNPYMKGLFDKIGVEFQVCKVGTFKSAVEPFTMEHMSDPARAQLDTLYGALWGNISGAIAESRKIKQSEIDSLINRNVVMFTSLDMLKKAKLIDGTPYEREMMQKLAWLTNREADDLNFVSPTTLAGTTSFFENPNSKNQIAVYYLSGEISEVGDGGINCFDVVPDLVALADNDNVKGLVLRVNSPGGSVYGSEQIWEAVTYFKSKGKPVAVSMGDYAASGGYYISCEADRIFANPLTITGSIGIFGLFPNASQLIQKIGVNIETVSTNPNGVLAVPMQPLTQEQMASAQAWIEKGYEQFCGRVAKGRGMKIEAVKVIAEGRVWSAEKAKEIGLVDELGQLNDAILWVANKAEIADNYNTCAYPAVEDNFWSIIPQNISNAMVDQLATREDMKLPVDFISYVKYVLARNPIQAHMQPVSANL